MSGTEKIAVKSVFGLALREHAVVSFKNFGGLARSRYETMCRIELVWNQIPFSEEFEL
jgi:hypothetical protein